MANLNGFNANNVEPATDFDPIPAAKYLAVITNSEFKPTKNNSGNYLEDVLQEIVLEMLTLNYDPNKSYQTNELTVFTSMVDHKILDIVRKIQFEKYFMEKQSHNVKTECDDIAQLQMSMDIQFALKALSTMEQQICMKLATGLSINEIAAEKKWSHNKTQRVVSALRRKLTKINLKNYINEK